MWDVVCQMAQGNNRRRDPGGRTNRGTGTRREVSLALASLGTCQLGFIGSRETRHPRSLRELPKRRAMQKLASF
jgi:hypothetical protein